MQLRTQARAPRTGECLVRAHIEAATFTEFRKKFVSEYVSWKPEEVPE